MNVDDLVRKKGFCRCAQISSEGHPGFGANEQCLRDKRGILGHRDTQRAGPCEDRGREWSDAAKG